MLCACMRTRVSVYVRARVCDIFIDRKIRQPKNINTHVVKDLYLSFAVENVDRKALPIFTGRGTMDLINSNNKGSMYPIKFYRTKARFPPIIDAQYKKIGHNCEN